MRTYKITVNGNLVGITTLTTEQVKRLNNDRDIIIETV
jgi:hypothetical protein